ncbi:hypothetical protein ACQ856_25040 [Mycolicibacterium psychrotolerans]|uniref:hypothetical protein n=1 Tax=Mycobacteriaceae TaxID=1762 RepID=UPI0011ECF58D|nr:hypothetical protein [Mycobacterium sp. ELW1]QEN14944.1 hypothetical protein D3H54_18240 [Mycobacterium sp. ELW1]
MNVRGKISLLTTAVVAASLISAPVAGARQTCHDAGSHVMCETSGSVSIKAVPQTRAPNVSEITPNSRDRRRGIVWSW